MKTKIQILLCSILSVSPSISLATCADLRGTYSECQLVGNRDEKFSFELTQGFRAGDPIYRAKGTRDGKPLTVPFLANAEIQQLLSDQKEVLAPIELNYVATCDPTQLIVSVTSPALGQAVVEKFFIAKSPEGNLQIKNQSLVLGRPIAERKVDCKRIQ